MAPLTTGKPFMMKGESYRGRKLETLAVEAGGTATLLGHK